MGRQTIRLFLALAAIAATALIGAPTAQAAPNGLFAYIGSTGDNTVRVVDAASATVTATVTTGADPANLATSANQRHVYTSNAGSDTVSVIDTRTNRVVATIPVGRKPGCLALHRNRLYVANTQAASVSVINTNANRVIATIHTPKPADCVAVHPNGRIVYVSSYDLRQGSITLINARTNTVTSSITGHGGASIAVHPKGTKLYLGSYTAVTVLDTAGHFLHNVRWGTTGDVPAHFSFAADHRHLYVAGLRGYDLLDTATDTFPGFGVFSPPSPPPNPVSCISASPDGRYLFSCWTRRGTHLEIRNLMTNTTATVPLPSAEGSTLVRR